MDRRLMLLALLLLLCASCGYARRDVVVMLLTEGITLDQLQQWDLPSSRACMTVGALGLLNNNSAGTLSYENNVLTIGAGAFAGVAETADAPKQHFWEVGAGAASGANASNEIVQGFGVAERLGDATAGERYQQATGLATQAQGVVQVQIAALRALNRSRSYPVIPGLLGEQLRRSVAISVFGNADAGHARIRHAVVVAMDAQGVVPAGDVEARTLLSDKTRPFGVRTNYAYLLARLAALPAGRHFVVIEAGDCSRALHLKNAWSRAQVKRLAVDECCRFLLALRTQLQHAGDHYLLMAVTAAPDAGAVAQGNLLTPILFMGSDLHTGVLTSATTHRRGIITNIDLAPSILEFFQLPAPAEMLGHPVTVALFKDPYARVYTLHRNLLALNASRVLVLVGYIAVLLAGLCWMALRFGLGKRTLRHPAASLLAALLCVPALFLLCSWVKLFQPLPCGLALLGAVIIITYLYHRWGGDIRTCLAISGLATTAVICLDLLLGTPMMKQAVMSYNPINGGRYYGMGNAYCEVLLAAVLLGVSAWLDLRGCWRTSYLWYLLPLFGVIIVLTGGPSFGAEFGGLFSALAGFLTMCIMCYPSPIRRSLTLRLGGVGVLLLLLIVTADVLLGFSHIGAAFKHALLGDPGVLWRIAISKWLMNYHLIISSPGTIALTVLLIVFTVFFFTTSSRLRAIFLPHPLLLASCTGILITMLVAMVTNDTGISMVAIGMIYLLVPLVILWREQTSRNTL